LNDPPTKTRRARLGPTRMGLFSCASSKRRPDVDEPTPQPPPPQPQHDVALQPNEHHVSESGGHPATIAAEAAADEPAAGSPDASSRLRRTKPFWELKKQASEPTDSGDVCPISPQPVSPAVGKKASAGCRSGSNVGTAAAQERPAGSSWDVLDMEEDVESPSAPRAYHPRHDPSTLPPLARTIDLGAGARKLPPLGAPLPTLAGRRAVPAIMHVATPASPQATAPAPAEARSPLHEVSANCVQRFVMSPATPKLKLSDRLALPPLAATTPLASSASDGASVIDLDAEAESSALGSCPATAVGAAKAERRARWAQTVVSNVLLLHDAPDVDEAPQDLYKQNLAELDRMRRERRAKGQLPLPFRELVAELDMAQGGEALSHLSKLLPPQI